MGVLSLHRSVRLGPRWRGGLCMSSKYSTYVRIAELQRATPLLAEVAAMVGRQSPSQPVEFNLGIVLRTVEVSDAAGYGLMGESDPALLNCPT